MNEQQSSQTISGLCGFCLLCGSIVLPFLIGLVVRDFWFMVAAAGLAQLGALICGLIGWRELTGKVAAIGGGVLLLLLIAFVVFLLYGDVGGSRGAPL